MTEIFRRVYRIFAHAWFQHREVFWKVEYRTGIYVFFKTVCDEYRLIPEDNYTIPPEAEGIESTPIATHHTQPNVMRREAEQTAPEEGVGEPAGNVVTATGNTTKRHRQGYADRQSSVSTIIHEEAEEEEDNAETESSPARVQVTEIEPGESPEEVSTEPPMVIIQAEDEPAESAPLAKSPEIPQFPVHDTSSTTTADQEETKQEEQSQDQQDQEASTDATTAPMEEPAAEESSAKESVDSTEAPAEGEKEGSQEATETPD